MDGWVEIFRAGENTDSKGRTKVWTTADLDKMVNSYNPADFEAPIVVGHPQGSNAPAYGWVEGLKRVGETLLAKFKQMTPEFTKWVEAAHYKKRSIRVLADGTLGHVAFLGASPPAINGLKDIEFSGGADGSDYDFTQDEEDFMDARVKELEEQLAVEKQKTQKLEAERNDFKAKAEKGEADFTAAQKTARKKEISDFVEQGIKDGKILPSWKEKGIVDFMTALDDQGGEFEFSAAGTATKQSPLDFFKGFIADFAAHPLFKDMVKPEDEQKKADEDFSADEKLAADMASYITPQKK